MGRRQYLRGPRRGVNRFVSSCHAFVNTVIYQKATRNMSAAQGLGFAVAASAAAMAFAAWQNTTQPTLVRAQSDAATAPALKKSNSSGGAKMLRRHSSGDHAVCKPGSPRPPWHTACKTFCCVTHKDTPVL